MDGPKRRAAAMRAASRLPAAAVQALWVAARAARLPEASGPRSGRAGAGPPLRVLIAGDSSAAGVGVATQDEALAGRLAARLSDRFAVEWRLVARSGATAGSLRRLLEAGKPWRCDVAVVAVGVNDAKNGGPARRWARDCAALLDALHLRHGARRVHASGVPPMRAFPLLPAPLRDVLGDRSETFDAILRGAALARPWARHLPLDFVMDASGMAADGFHPGAAVYDAWAGALAERITAQDV